MSAMNEIEKVGGWREGLAFLTGVGMMLDEAKRLLEWSPALRELEKKALALKELSNDVYDFDKFRPRPAPQEASPNPDGVKAYWDHLCEQDARPAKRTYNISAENKAKQAEKMREYWRKRKEQQRGTTAEGETA